MIYLPGIFELFLDRTPEKHGRGTAELPVDTYLDCDVLEYLGMLGWKFVFIVLLTCKYVMWMCLGVVVC